LQVNFKAHVAHDRSDNFFPGKFPTLGHEPGTKGQNTVSIPDLALVVHRDHPVPIPVESKTDVRPLGKHAGSIYHLYETEFGTPMIRADEKLRAAAADAGAAQALGVVAGTPLLSVERVAFTYGDRPVEWRRGLYRTDKHYYRNVLT